MAEQLESGGGTRWRAILIEADDHYRAVMATCIGLANGRSDQFRNLTTALQALDHQSVDLVLWGVDRSEQSRRTELISEMRLRTEAPLIVVDDGTDSAQLNLEAGADRWLPRPFIPGALVASIRAALRQSASSVMEIASHAEIRGMVLDGRRRTLAFDGSVVTFTRQEWSLLSVLVNHPNRFLSAREIVRLGWTAGEHGQEQLRTYVRRIRVKIAPLNPPCQLLSQHGHGYCLSFV
ncbi:MAG TPA: winged helix-turn-helix domain-containing protein [Candidatus Dormibacteraeota bacterium]|jgi:two-component system KDP operon response regulator KdpE|nr:winged helix-turn-helix domain-containing protein [Candidatus Dormibacteraeota bacterium]